MKQVRMIEVMEVSCDVCGQTCFNYRTQTIAGTEYHACSDFNEQLGSVCADLLEKGLGSIARAKLLAIAKEMAGAPRPLSDWEAVVRKHVEGDDATVTAVATAAKAHADALSQAVR
ncbi:hypothetical protein [Comamonas thiooxydans]|uniref:hypothetical protein n=1 Tax=Comamonas thiooxydans TaxID=363952 RepID=UPI000B41D415|nr:hypothetical protein [Comamonas thiooxydans]